MEQALARPRARQRHVVLYNPKAGKQRGIRREAQLRAALTVAGVQADLVPVEGRDLDTRLAEILERKPSMIIAAGGDGTVSGVARRLVGSDITLGILPLGTLNHFARDVGVPTDLNLAARTLRTGANRRVDVGEVNAVPFLNNASIGVYPHVIHRRRQLKRRLGWGKWTAMGVALLSISRRFPMVRVEVREHGRRTLRKTPFVFVGNNQYDLQLFQLGSRQRLDRGELCLYLAGRPGRLGALRMLARSATGRLRQGTDFTLLRQQRFTIQSGRPSMRVALDGEIHELVPPLLFRNIPRALIVRAPKVRS